MDSRVKLCLKTQLARHLSELIAVLSPFRRLARRRLQYFAMGATFWSTLIYDEIPVSRVRGGCGFIQRQPVSMSLKTGARMFDGDLVLGISPTGASHSNPNHFGKWHKDIVVWRPDGSHKLVTVIVERLLDCSDACWRMQKPSSRVNLKVSSARRRTDLEPFCVPTA